MFSKLCCLVIFIACTQVYTRAQTASEQSDDDTGDIFTTFNDKLHGGEINIYQSPSLIALLEKNIRINEKEGLEGFRIQIYSGTGNTARERASNIKKEFIQNFPDFNENLIYLDYQEPYFKVKVGDYRNKNEAFELYHNIKAKFPGSYIVKSKINYPILELPKGK